MLLEAKLSQLTIPYSVRNCRDVRCKQYSHKEDLDQYTLDVLELVQQVAEEVLPKPAVGPNKGGGTVRPGWNSHVRPYRDSAFFWHEVWRSCGSPFNTEVHNIMKRTRNLYHFQYRKCKRNGA